MIRTSLIFVGALALFGLTNCKKDTRQPEPTPDPTPGYTVPSTYDFANVNYSGQTARLDMVAEMKTYMNSGNSLGTVLSAQKLKDMYANTNSAFTNTALNVSGKNIRSKVFLADQSAFETYMEHIAAASTSTVNGSNGIAGVVVSTTDNTKKYLCDANGVEWTQVIEKGLMGSLMYYQTTAVYLSDSKIGNSVDNNSVTPGQGTNMEHHWDEAFGYFGVPTAFPGSIAGVRFWGKYCNDRNSQIGCNAAVMNAFIKGRAAISNKDYGTRDAQVTLIRNQWEKVMAATIISYINATKLKITDDAIRNHNLSEIKGFIMGFRCNPARQITDSEISQIEGLLNVSFYNIPVSNLDQIKTILSSRFGLDNVKDAL